MTRRGRKPGAWVVLVVALPLLAFGATAFGRRVDAVQPLTGIEWTQSSAGPIALSVEPHSAGAQAGLLVGDRLVAANGREVPSAIDAAELGWGLDGGKPILLEIDRGGTRANLHLLPNWVVRSEPYGYLALVGLAFWVSGLFIALRWPVIRGGSLYSLLSMALFAHLVLSHTGRADWFDALVYWTDRFAGAAIPPLLLHLGLVLSKRSLRHPWLVAGAGYATASVLLLGSVWLRPEALGGSLLFHDPRAVLEAWSRGEPLLLAVAWVVTSVLLIKAHAQTSSVLHRSQLRWLLWGLAVGFGPFVLLYAVPWAIGAPALPRWAEFVAVAPLVLVPGAFTSALARYRLHDLDMLLLRGITEVSALFASFAILAAAVFLLREGVAELFGLSRSATRYIGFFAAAVAYPQMRALARTVVERAFYRKRYSYRATLLDWARELNAETDLGSLLERLRARVRETLGVPRAEVLVRTGPTSFGAVDSGVTSSALELSAEAIERLERVSYVNHDPGGDDALPWARYLFSMKVKGQLRAVLGIAERRHSEEPLSTEDRALLGTLAAHASTAIEAARLFQEVRQRADEVERLHARQEKILESSAVGLLLLDGDGRIEACNRALEEIYGLGRDEAIGRRLADVFPLHVVRRIEREVGTQAAGEGARIFRLSLVNRHGHRLVVNLAISPVDGEARETRARVVTFDDVTERIKLEEQVLRQERLASLGLLAAGVAHEINTPLTGISSYTQMLLEDLPERDPRRSLLEKVETQTQRAARITRSLLNLARPEQTSLQALDVNRTLQEVLQLFEPQVRRTGIHLRVALADELPTIRGHRGKLQQVVLNLLINARDALDGEGDITVRSYRSDDRAVIEVADDGVGIADDDLPHIFDPFFTTKGRGLGTGLGLSISYGIVREHGGEIHVESQPGQFTRFRVELPLAETAKAMA